MDEALYDRLLREIAAEDDEKEEKTEKKKKKESASSAVVRNMYEKIPKRMLDEVSNPHQNMHGLKIPFRMCVVAPSGSGKTNFLINLLSLVSSAPGTFHSICIVTRNKNEPLYNWLQSLHDDIKVVEGLENTPVLDKMDKDLNHFVAFDDLVLAKNQERICNYYIRCRKLNCSVAYLSQSYFGIPKIVRQNCSYLIILRLGGSNREVNSILSEAGLGVNKEGLMKLYDEAVTNAPKFSILLIDFEEDPSKRFRKGFKDIIVPSE